LSKATEKVKGVISEALAQAGISVDQVQCFEPTPDDLYVPVMLVRLEDVQHQQRIEAELRKALRLATERVVSLEVDRQKLLRTIQILAGPDSPRTSTEGFEDLFAPPPPVVQGPLGSYGPSDFYPSCV